MKLRNFIHDLNETLEHYGDIEVDASIFEVEVVQPLDPDSQKEERYIITFVPVKRKPSQHTDPEIDKQALHLLDRLQQEISTFRSLRHLEDTGLSAELLMKRHKHALWDICGAAMSLAPYVFPGRSPHARFEWHEITEAVKGEE